MKRRFSIYGVFRDNLATKAYMWMFLVSSLSVVAFGLAVSVLSNPLERGRWVRVIFTILGMLAAIGTFEIWLGMWVYWARFDASKAWIKRLWFVVLLFGFLAGSILYFLTVYLPQVRGRDMYK